MIFEHDDYRDYLRSVLAERISRNPAYSLRAMARQLEWAPATLSQVLSGTRGMSLPRALQVAAKLELSPSETEYLSTLVQSASAKTPTAKDFHLSRLRALNPEQDFRELSVDAFKMIADWYHIPILEMTRLEGAALSEKTAAERLGITRVEARAALERLERLELIERHGKGYRRAPGRFQAASPAPNEALQNFHRQMLSKAAQSLASQTPKEKVVGSETFAMDPAALEEARRATDRYFDEIVRIAHESRQKTEVFHLGVQLFRVTAKQRNPKK